MKVLMRYNPTTTNWADECQLVEQQLENLLGTDYIDVIVQAGPETGFLSAVRHTGDYGLMKCNWGADFSDASAFIVDPFAEDSTTASSTRATIRRRRNTIRSTSLYGGRGAGHHR